MIVYKNVYDFTVIEEIAAGCEVYVLDRFEVYARSVSDLRVDRFAEILKTAKTDPERYLFWCVDEIEGEQSNDTV